MFNRSEIMTAAWVIVRRFKGNDETPGQRLSRALRCVWWDAKQNARRAREAAARAAAHVAQFAGLTAAQLRANLFAFECKDSLRGSDWTRLDAMRAALREAVAREALATLHKVLAQ